MDGNLKIAATPIGNLKDITLRTLSALSECSVILCEDTRRASKLLNHYNIRNKKLVSFYKETEKRKEDAVIDLIKENKTVLISDGGLPVLNDPGYMLIRRCVKEGINFEVLPGASSILTAVCGAALPSEEFYFGGFFPKKETQKKEMILKLKNIKMLSVFFESPLRIKKTLSFLNAYLPAQTEIVIGKELTKIHEKFIRTKADEIPEVLKNENLKGELALLINKISEPLKEVSDDEIFNEILSAQNEKKYPLKYIMKELSKKYALPKRKVYKIWLTRKEK